MAMLVPGRDAAMTFLTAARIVGIFSLESRSMATTSSFPFNLPSALLIFPSRSKAAR